MCTTIPGRVTKVDGPLAEVEIDGRTMQCNALSQPDVKVGDYVLTHANLIVAIISAEEAQQMLDAVRELADAAEHENCQEAESGGSDPASGSELGRRLR
jgi:hydrogenase assembly chaperone HypC/HupF